MGNRGHSFILISYVLLSVGAELMYIQGWVEYYVHFEFPLKMSHMQKETFFITFHTTGQYKNTVSDVSHAMYQA